MAVISGMGGHVDQGGVAINCVRKWNINYNSTTQEIVCSATNGGRLRIAGNKDWQGSFTGYGEIPPVNPGDLFTFNGAITGTGASAVGASGAAIVESVVINIDVEGGTPLNYQVNFASNGALTLGSVTVVADTAVPDPLDAVGLDVEIAAPAASPSFSGVHEVRTATLTLLANNVAYVASDTDGETKRIAGNIDATLQLTCYAKDTDGWASFPAPNDVKHVRLYTDSGKTRYWDLKWIMFSGLTGLDVDIETSALVGCTVDGALSGYTDVGGTPTEGGITDPDSTAIWPAP